MITRLRIGTLLIAWIVFAGMVYGPDVGRGFVKDDFTWIRSAKAALDEPARLILPREPGFYRPVVTSTFVLDYLSHDLDARHYGWTNLFLYAACGVAVAALAIVLGLGFPAAALAAFAWAVNPHGINMAVIWLSGRTALCLTLFATLAAIAFLKQRWFAAGVCLFIALASKEEAIALPFILLAWGWLLRTHEKAPRAMFIAVFAPLVLYGAARAMTPAFTPADAPSFYQFSVQPAHVARNIWEYFDRSSTVVVAIVLIAALLYRRAPALDTRTREILEMTAIWWAGMFAITIWLPVRSSLYAVCPAVASAIAGAAVIDAMRSARGAWLELVVGVLVLAAIPVYRIRNDPWVEGARVSARTLRVIESDLPRLPSSGTIVLHDEPNTVSNFHNAFGDLLTEALQTVSGRPLQGRIDAPAGDVIAEYRLVRGRVERIER